jgi:hypothetical protein
LIKGDKIKISTIDFVGISDKALRKAMKDINRKNILQNLKTSKFVKQNIKLT